MVSTTYCTFQCKYYILHVFHVRALKNVTYIMDQQMHIYKYVQSHIILLQEHLSVTLVTTIRGSYNKNTIKIQIIVQKLMINPLTIT